MILKTNSYRNLLVEELNRRQRLNSRYSQRAFARNLGMSAGELSEVLRGRRSLSLKSALKVAKSLGFNTTETKHLLHLTQLEKSQALGAEGMIADVHLGLEKQEMSLEVFEMVSDWSCFAILNLADCQDFRFDEKWIAKRLGIQASMVHVSLQRLERVGLVKVQNGRRVIDKEYVFAPSGIPSGAIKNYHREILKKAIEALDLQKLEEREISGLGMAIDPEDLESMRKDIQEFQDQMVAKYAKTKKGKEVYQLEVSFFRMTKGESYDS